MNRDVPSVPPIIPNTVKKVDPLSEKINSITSETDEILNRLIKRGVTKPDSPEEVLPIRESVAEKTVSRIEAIRAREEYIAKKKKEGGK